MSTYLSVMYPLSIIYLPTYHLCIYDLLLIYLIYLYTYIIYETIIFKEVMSLVERHREARGRKRKSGNNVNIVLCIKFSKELI